MRAIALSPDSKLLAASSFDDAVRVWDPDNGREIYRLAGHGRVGGRRSLRFTPDGRALFSWGDDFFLRAWDMKTGKARLEVHPQGFDDDAQRNRKGLGLDFAETVFAPDGKTFVLDHGALVHLFDTTSGKEKLKFASEGRFRSSLVVTPDGRTLVASAWGDRQVGQHPVTLFDLSSGGALQRLLLPGMVGGVVAVSPDGRTFATSVEGTQRQILVYEIASGNLRARVGGVPDRVWSLAFLPDCRRLASGQTNSTALIWDLAAPEIFHKEP